MGAEMPYSATLCCTEAIGATPAYPRGWFFFSLGPSKHVHMPEQKISFTKEAHFRCKCSMGCCTNEACLIFKFLKKLFIYFNAPLETVSALLCLLRLSMLLCCGSRGQGGGNLFGGIYRLYYAVVGSAWMAGRAVIIPDIIPGIISL